MGVLKTNGIPSRVRNHEARTLEGSSWHRTTKTANRGATAGVRVGPVARIPRRKVTQVASSSPGTSARDTVTSDDDTGHESVTAAGR